MRRNQRAEQQMALPGLGGISADMPTTPAVSDDDDAWLTAILEWGQSHSYEPRIGAPKNAGELLRIVMDRPEVQEAA
jgi:hypothetical protein